MIRPVRLTITAVLVALAGCAGPDWTAGETAVVAATADCEDWTNGQMRLRGWPPRPYPGSPQANARAALFEDCMRRRGMTPG